jgi:hypothetical protein
MEKMGMIGFKNGRLKLVRGVKLGYRVAVSFILPLLAPSSPASLQKSMSDLRFGHGTWKSLRGKGSACQADDEDLAMVVIAVTIAYRKDAFDEHCARGNKKQFYDDSGEG